MRLSSKLTAVCFFALTAVAVAQSLGPPNIGGITSSGSPSNNDCAKFVVSGSIVQSITTTGGPCAASSSIVSVKKQTFTSNGTYTPSAGMLFAVVECQGPGGGGGGVAGATGNSGSGGNGSSGGYSKVLVTAAQIGVSKAVTVPVGGTAGSAGNNPGGNASATSVGILCVANGGFGGGGTTAGSVRGAGGAAPASGTGDVAIPGTAGSPGTSIPLITFVIATYPSPSSFYGAGAPSNVTDSTVTSCGGFGSGGAGGLEVNDNSTQAGSAGCPGLVYITEYNSQ